MRLFIAILLSDEMKKTLVECMHDLKKQGVTGNYIPAQNLHLTLAFIGEYDNPRKVKEVIDRIPLPEFRLSLSGFGRFGSILWAGVKGSQKLAAYARELRAALMAEGIPCDQEKFVPHITLIRRAASSKLYEVHLGKADMMVKRASLMRSEQRDGKVVYRELR